MRILLVSYFPRGSSAVGAQRIIALEAFLRDAGHDVALLTASSAGAATLIGSAAPTSERNILGSRYENGASGADGGTQADNRAWIPTRVRRSALWESAGAAKRALIDWTGTSAHRAWHADAKLLFDSDLRIQQFDVVVSSGPPWVCHKIGRYVALRQNARWAPDYRDLWTNSSYYPHPGWKRMVESELEKSWLRDASLVTTVTPGLAAQLRALSPPTPCHTIWNGYGAEELDSVPAKDLGIGRHLVYAGTWYPGRRDPRPLLKALSLNPAIADVRLHLVGETPFSLPEEVAALGLGPRVIFHGNVPRASALAIVKGGDVAVVIGWNDPRDRDVAGAKIFELMGLRKPVLASCYAHGVLADIIRRYGHGTVANTPEALAEAIATLLGRVAKSEGPTIESVENFERKHQMRIWEQLLSSDSSGTSLV